MKGDLLISFLASTAPRGHKKKGPNTKMSKMIEPDDFPPDEIVAEMYCHIIFWIGDLRGSWPLGGWELPGSRRGARTLAQKEAVALRAINLARKDVFRDFPY
jgi:hypothetical protein